MFHSINLLFFVFLSLTMVGPIIQLAAVSLSAPVYVKANLVFLWPKGFQLEVYKHIFNQTFIWKSLGISVYITVLGTLFALFFTCTLAFSLSRPQMKGRAWIMKGIIVTFIFSVPLIPFFMVVKQLGMLNTLWSLMIPGALSAFNVIIMKTFFQGISEEIMDAAQIDGGSEYSLLIRIAFPLSLPPIATIGLFHAVGQWNAYFHAIIFLRDRWLYPIQVVLKGMVVDEGMLEMRSSVGLIAQSPTEQLLAGILLFATLPILVVYPFIQKYFVKGSMLGALKE